MGEWRPCGCEVVVPRISEFYGIAIAMYHREHTPPHFHVRYGGYRASVSIDPLQLMRGTLPRRVEAMVFEWATLHKAELAVNWRRAQARQTLAPIAPLE